METASLLILPSHEKSCVTWENAMGARLRLGVLFPEHRIPTHSPCKVIIYSFFRSGRAEPADRYLLNCIYIAESRASRKCQNRQCRCPTPFLSARPTVGDMSPRTFWSTALWISQVDGVELTKEMQNSGSFFDLKRSLCSVASTQVLPFEYSVANRAFSR